MSGIPSGSIPAGARGATPGLTQIDTDLQQLIKAINRLTETTGQIPTLVLVTQGGTGATTAAGARTNLGIGTLGTENSNSVAITGGTIDGTNIGETTPAFVAATTLINNGASADESGDYHQPASGFTITVPNGSSWLILDPSGTLGSGTVVMPVGPIDGQNVIISTSHAITGFTVSPNGPQTLNGAPTTIVANTSMWWRYRLANTTWYRLL
jgi:ABC-type glycerol-3-phosphate transport system substrate-binding protein